MTDKRVYRKLEPSDLPAVQSGKLQVLFDSADDSVNSKIPARLVSTQYGSFGRAKDRTTVAFLVKYSNGNELLLEYKFESGSFVIDITPEKRYAIWNKKRDRFMIADHDVTPHFNTEQQAKDYITQKFAYNDRTAFAIVSFDYPGE